MTGMNMDDVGSNRVHIYLAIKRVGADFQRIPKRVTDEAVMDGESVALMTYDWTNVVVGMPAETIFQLPDGHTHKSCERYVGGFPYLHVFHFYYRF